MQIEAQMGLAGSVWVGYLNVADVDATVHAIQQAGGTLCIPGTDIPGGYGRFAMVLDPQGAPLYVMRPGGEGESSAFAPRVGHCQWNELVTSDPEGATDFYARIFGWTRGDVMPMGPLGNYQFLLNGSERFGAVMKRSREDVSIIFFIFPASLQAGDVVVSHRMLRARGATAPWPGPPAAREERETAPPSG